MQCEPHSSTSLKEQTCQCSCVVVIQVQISNVHHSLQQLQVRANAQRPDVMTVHVSAQDCGILVLSRSSFKIAKGSLITHIVPRTDNPPRTAGQRNAGQFFVSETYLYPWSGEIVRDERGHRSTYYDYAHHQTQTSPHCSHTWGKIGRDNNATDERKCANHTPKHPSIQSSQDTIHPKYPGKQIFRSQHQDTTAESRAGVSLCLRTQSSIVHLQPPQVARSDRM